MKVINQMVNTVINGTFCGGDSYTSTSNGSSHNLKNMKKFQYNEELEIPAEDIGIVKIEADAVSVTVGTGGDEVTAQVNGYSISEKEYNISLFCHKGSLYVKVSNENNATNESDVNISVTIPEKILLKNVRMDVSSGDVCMKCSKIISERADILLSAGNLKIDNVLPSKEINMEINAGSANIKGEIKADTIINSNINSGSFKISCKNINRILPDIRLNAASQHFAPILDGEYEMKLKAVISCGSLEVS